MAVRDWSAALRERWARVPTAGADRTSSAALLELDDADLLAFWRSAQDERSRLEADGWYQLLYRDYVRSRRILDIGCGLGLSSLTFAEQGASLLCADVVESNIAVVERIADLIGVAERVDCVFLETPQAVATLPDGFDAVLALGSLHHAPMEVVGPEARELAARLRPGGRWLQFAYPKERWRRAGGPDFAEWGVMTDGPETPWAEWYDASKLLELLAPHPFQVVFETEWFDRQFCWMDLVRV